MKVLDHGYVNLIEHWGSDERIIEAARMSTNKGFQGWGDFVACNTCKATGRVWEDYDAQLHQSYFATCPDCDGNKGSGTKGDEKLLRYLYKNSHSTPFEMAGCIIEVQAPIFVFREWMRHRTQSYNELSARYTEVPELYYVPSLERLRNGGQSKTNKQSSGEVLSEDEAKACQQIIDTESEHVFLTYRDMINRGLSRELARVVLPVNTYSRMRASANLRNWLGFLTLRQADNAQWETRQYANAVHDILKPLFPRTMGLFDE